MLVEARSVEAVSASSRSNGFLHLLETDRADGRFKKNELHCPDILLLINSRH
jgi:hypothetical protein